MSNALKNRENSYLKELLTDNKEFFQNELLEKSRENIIGANFGLKQVIQMAKQVAEKDSPVLITGDRITSYNVCYNTKLLRQHIQGKYF